MKLQRESSGGCSVSGRNPPSVGNPANTHRAYVKGNKVTTTSATPALAIPAADKPTFFRGFLSKLQPKPSLPPPPTPTTASSQSLRSRKTARIFALPEAWKTTLFRAQTPTSATPSATSTTFTHPKFTTVVHTPNASTSSLQDTLGTTKRNPIPAHWRIEPLASERELLLSEREKREFRRDSAGSSWGREQGREQQGRGSEWTDEDDYVYDGGENAYWKVLEEWVLQHKILVEDYEDLMRDGGGV